MARLAKTITLKVITKESKNESESEDSVIDDIHEDVAPLLHSATDTSSSDSDDSMSSMDGNEAQHDEYLIARNGTQWKIIDENYAVPGRAIQANVLNPAPGLTTYARQRIRDNPILDSFLLFFSPGKFSCLQVSII